MVPAYWTTALVALTFLVSCVEAAESSYYFFYLTEQKVKGNFSGLAVAQTLCEEARDLRHWEGDTVPVLLAAPGTFTFQPGLNVSGPSGILIGVSDQINSISSSDFLTHSLQEAEVGTPNGGCEPFWTGFYEGMTHSSGSSCTSWTSQGGLAFSGSCDYKNANWYYGGLSPCNTELRILCALKGNTPAPTQSPSTAPSQAPSFSSPTTSPSTSKPSQAPVTGVPSKAPTRTNYPTPFTSSPTGDDAETSGSSLSTLAVPIGAGVGGGVALLLVLATVITLSRKRRARRQSNLAIVGK